MPYPFPGMNPWLENRRLWSDVHQRVITLLADQLGGQLEPRYFVGVGTHTYIATLPEPWEEPYLVVELLSHTNKRAGDERRIYLQKRGEFLSSDVHFVEIDLLRGGEAMPYCGEPPADYRIVVRRRERPQQLLVYPFSLRQPVPIFALPLLPGDAEPLVDLGALLQTVYDRARYWLVIDDTQPPDPPLTLVDAEWTMDALRG